MASHTILVQVAYLCLERSLPDATHPALLVVGRLTWRAKSRGWLELDVLMGTFVEKPLRHIFVAPCFESQGGSQDHATCIRKHAQA